MQSIYYQGRNSRLLCHLSPEVLGLESPAVLWVTNQRPQKCQWEKKGHQVHLAVDSETPDYSTDRWGSDGSLLAGILTKRALVGLRLCSVT